MEPVLVCSMRTGIDITVSAACRQRLEAIAADRNTPQKHVWRACIVLLTADGLGTGAIMAATGRPIFLQPGLHPLKEVSRDDRGYRDSNPFLPIATRLRL